MGGKGKGKRKDVSNDDLDAELAKYMGDDAVGSRLDNELEAYMKGD